MSAMSSVIHLEFVSTCQDSIPCSERAPPLIRFAHAGLTHHAAEQARIILFMHI